MASEKEAQVEDVSEDPSSPDDLNNSQTKEESESVSEIAVETQKLEICNSKEDKCLSTDSMIEDDQPSNDPSNEPSPPSEENEENLEQCLEPRPPYLAELEGSESPKDVHKKLMRKVNQMNTNGDTVIQPTGSLEHSMESVEDHQTNHEEIVPSAMPTGSHVQQHQPQKHKNSFSLFKRLHVHVGY